jgi:hypothetical protein
MPYEARGKCVYKKDGGAKVGCTKGSVKKYLAALHANADESVEDVVEETQETPDKLARLEKNNASRPTAMYESDKHMIKNLLRKVL